jgi:hypothetical protein
VDDVEVKIVRYLDEFGFKYSLLGFQYAVVIIAHCLKNPEDMHQICKTYRICAQKVGTTPMRFERALRHEIRIHAKAEDTNKEFIARAVNELRIELYSQKWNRKV